MKKEKNTRLTELQRSMSKGPVETVQETTQGTVNAATPQCLTADNGRPVADNQNVQTAGQRGPMVLQDPWFLEKLAHFDREVIPERRMHAKGSGAYGTFTVTHDITKYTRASIFSAVGKKTECFVRFSTVAGERGAADAERDIRGFAMKFYTDTGNWDLVGNNTPVFFPPRPSQIPRPEPRHKEGSAYKYAQRKQQLGFLDTLARGASSGYNYHEPARYSVLLPPYARFREPHLQFYKCCEREDLGEVPPEDTAGDKEPY